MIFALSRYHLLCWVWALTHSTICSMGALLNSPRILHWWFKFMTPPIEDSSSRPMTRARWRWRLPTQPKNWSVNTNQKCKLISFGKTVDPVKGSLTKSTSFLVLWQSILEDDTTQWSLNIVSTDILYIYLPRFSVYFSPLKYHQYLIWKYFALFVFSYAIEVVFTLSKIKTDTKMFFSSHCGRNLFIKGGVN